MFGATRSTGSASGFQQAGFFDAANVIQMLGSMVTEAVRVGKYKTKFRRLWMVYNQTVAYFVNWIL